MLFFLVVVVAVTVVAVTMVVALCRVRCWKFLIYPNVYAS